MRIHLLSKNIKLKIQKKESDLNMVEIILISHEEVGAYLLRSAELILGDQDHVFAYSLKRGDDIEKFSNLIEKKLEELREKKILVLTDIFGGTPSNIVAANLKNHDYKCISGMNLPMLLEALELRENEKLEMDELVSECIRVGREGIQDIKKVITSQIKQED